jgi:tetraacyldisaccharide 4'-kinase
MGKGSMLIFEAMKLLRIVLTPISWIYAAVLQLRHFMYDAGIFKSKQFNTPVICIGNLSLGGTGKTPFTIYIAEKLSAKHKVAILSRGYKRKTEGFLIINNTNSANDVGDEPLLMHNSLNGVTVAVDANRVRGIEKLIEQIKPDVILLDDAFQHRKVKAHLNILLTDYQNLYFKDCLLPAGRLRDVPSRARAAEVIVVTKCPDKIDSEKLKSVIKRKPDQNIFFTKQINKELRSLENNSKMPVSHLVNKKVVLFTGIAKPNYLVDFLQSKGAEVNHLDFADHHNYRQSDLKKVREIFDNFGPAEKLIITTEKDAIKLTSPVLKTSLSTLPVYAIDAQIEFLKDEVLFLNIIAQYA